jgi:hypothetical protein
MVHQLDRDEDSDFSDAMLYALNDPLLDRDAFEKRLANHPELCDQVAEAVEILDQIRCAGGVPSLAASVSRSRPTDLPVWNWVVVTAASLALIAGLGWAVWKPYDSEQVAVGKVLEAWAAIQNDPGDSYGLLDDSRGTRSDYSYSENSWFPSDDDDSDALPEWLIAATAAHESTLAGEAVQ